MFEFVVGVAFIFCYYQNVVKGKCRSYPCALLNNTTLTRMKIGDVAVLILSFGTIWK